MIKVETLANGITLVTQMMPQMESVAMGIWVRTGAVDETEETSGLSHYIEHMMFKGTDKYSAAELAEAVDCIGGQMNAFTGKEATCYYIRTLGSSMDMGLDILTDMFTRSVFDPEEMEREKHVIYEEMKMVQDSPDEDVHDMICEEVFRGMPLGNNVLGSQDVLAGIDRETLYGYYRSHYTKNNIVVAAAGNFDRDKFKEMVLKKLEVMEDMAPAREMAARAYKPGAIVKVKDIEQSHLCMAVPTVDLANDDFYAYSVLNGIMGNSMSSRLFQNIRERKGLAYSVFSANCIFAADGYYNIYAGISHENVQAAIEAIKEELEILKAEGVSDAEIRKAKEQMKSNYAFGQESVNARMFSLGKSQLLIGRTEEPEEVVAQIEKVDREALQKTIDVISDAENYTAALITNKETDLEAMIRG